MFDRITFWALAQLARREEGQTMAEYAVVLTLITAAIIATLVVLSGNINTVLDGIAKVIKVK